MKNLAEMAQVATTVKGVIDGDPALEAKIPGSRIIMKALSRLLADEVAHVQLEQGPPERFFIVMESAGYPRTDALRLWEMMWTSTL